MTFALTNSEWREAIGFVPSPAAKERANQLGFSLAVELVKLGLNDNAGIQKVLVLNLPDEKAQTGWGVSEDPQWTEDKLTAWDWSVVAKVLALAKAKAYRLAEDLAVPEGFSEEAVKDRNNNQNLQAYCELIWGYMLYGMNAVKGGFSGELPSKRYRTLTEFLQEVEYRYFIETEPLSSLGQEDTLKKLKLNSEGVYVPMTNWDLKALGHKHHNCVFAHRKKIESHSVLVVEYNMPFGPVCTELDAYDCSLIEAKLPYNKYLSEEQEEELVLRVKQTLLSGIGNSLAKEIAQRAGFLAGTIPETLVELEDLASNFEGAMECLESYSKYRQDGWRLDLLDGYLGIIVLEVDLSGSPLQVFVGIDPSGLSFMATPKNWLWPEDESESEDLYYNLSWAVNRQLQLWYSILYYNEVPHLIVNVDSPDQGWATAVDWPKKLEKPSSRRREDGKFRSESWDIPDFIEVAPYSTLYKLGTSISLYFGDEIYISSGPSEKPQFQGVVGDFINQNIVVRDNLVLGYAIAWPINGIYSGWRLLDGYGIEQYIHNFSSEYTLCDYQKVVEKWSQSPEEEWDEEYEYVAED